MNAIQLNSTGEGNGSSVPTGDAGKSQQPVGNAGSSVTRKTGQEEIPHSLQQAGIEYSSDGSVMLHASIPQFLQLSPNRQKEFSDAYDALLKERLLSESQ